MACQFTTVVADTGDIAAMKLYQPQDATTNPSLILNAAQIPEYRKLIDDAVTWAKAQSNDRAQQVVDATDKLAVNIGLEILKLVPGRISGVCVSGWMSTRTWSFCVRCQKPLLWPGCAVDLPWQIKR
jgi:transaldolase